MFVSSRKGTGHFSSEKVKSCQGAAFSISDNKGEALMRSQQLKFVGQRTREDRAVQRQKAAGFH